jgi:hypothetical protein
MSVANHGAVQLAAFEVEVAGGETSVGGERLAGVGHHLPQTEIGDSDKIEAFLVEQVETFAEVDHSAKHERLLDGRMSTA